MLWGAFGRVIDPPITHTPVADSIRFGLSVGAARGVGRVVNWLDRWANVNNAQTTRAIPTQNQLPRNTESIRINDAQFGKKIGKHAQDYGLNPRDPAARTFLRGRINDIHNKPTEIRQGVFRGQGELLPSGKHATGQVRFYIQGNEIVVTDLRGNFVSIMRGGVNNPYVKNARTIWP